MNQESARKAVDYYLSYNLTEPLVFLHGTYNPKTRKYDYKKKNPEDLVISKSNQLHFVIKRVLEYALDYSSGLESLEFETSPGALRSSLDIWRHIKYYNPDITIYEVMKCLSDFCDDLELYGHYCCTIERRVFRISDYDDFESGINDAYEDDEYGLLFKDWKLL